MNKDEALRLALEALGSNRRTHHYCEDTWYSCPKHEDGCANDSEGDECNCGADKANAGIDQAITAIKEALAQSEQDLVEWGVDWGPDGNSVSIIKRLADGGIEVVGWEYAPHPPQRTWVTLTEDEIVLISADCAATHQHTDIHFAKAIEAKLRSKNNG
jgi:hypothetical protein